MRAALMLATLLVAAPAWAAPQNLKVSTSGSFVYALAYKGGMASAVAHDHVIHATELSGGAVYDPDNAAGCSIEVKIPVASLITDTDELRKSVGLKSRVSDGQREEILSHIFAKYQLYAEQYTHITFKSTAVSGTADRLVVTGDFTLRGVTKSITVPLDIAESGEGIIAVGGFKVLQSDYGYNPFSALFGALKVKDEVDILLKVNLQP